MSDVTIPAAALEAAARQICGYERDQDADWREYIGHARAACLAMLAAWPGMQHDNYVIILPLPAEASDE